MQALPDGEPAVQALMLASRALVGLTVRALAEVGADVTIPQFRTLVVMSTRGSMGKCFTQRETRPEGGEASGAPGAMRSARPPSTFWMSSR